MGCPGNRRTLITRGARAHRPDIMRSKAGALTRRTGITIYYAEKG
jgi:hypothetical protein